MGHWLADVTDNYFNINHKNYKYVNIYGNKTPTIHGTFVACCFGATINNNIGIASAGGLNTELSGSTNWTSDSEVLSLALQGFRVINCSWFNSCSYSTIQDALYDEIRNIRNTVVIFGAGNGTVHCNGGKIYPALYGSCVSVTSIGHRNEIGTLENGQPIN